MAARTTDERAPEPDVTASDGPTGSRDADRLGALLMLVPVAVLVVLGWTHRWVDEDAFLNFRMAGRIRLRIRGYLAGPEVLVHEYNSLADPVGSHMPPNPGSGPGHRKRKGYPWVVALTTKPGVTAGFDGRRIAAARAALRCGALRDLVASTEDPMDPGTFWSNLTGAVGRTGLVVPRDEFGAERTFCGDPGTIRP